MKTFITKTLNKKYVPVIILILAIIPAFVTLLRPGFFFIQDDLQTFRIQQMDKCIKDGQLPCRWIPDGGYGYGYPLFNYYPPSVYYLGDLFHLIGFQFIDTVKILFILGFIASALAMYFLLEYLMGRLPAFVGALLYTYVPYRALDSYVRGDINEFWSLAFFPLIFLSTLRLVRTGSKKDMAFVSLSVGGLFLTHNLMSLIFFPIAILWTLGWILVEKRFKRLPKLILAGVIGLGLALTFTLPVIFEGKYAHIESLLGGYFGYQQHFVDIWELFISNHWGYGSSVLGPNDDLSLSTGPVHWMVGLLAVILAAVYYKKNKNLSRIVFMLAIIELTVLFLMHERSTFIWDRLTFLAWLQFPWRFLADSIFILSFLGATAIYFVTKLNNKYLSWILSGLVLASILILHLSFFQAKDWQYISDREKFSGKMLQHQLTASIFDYLPIYAKLPPISPAPDKPDVLTGQANFGNYSKGSDYQYGQVVVTSPATIRLPLFDFPGMKLSVDGQPMAFTHLNCQGEEFCLGLMTFNLSPGNHFIEAKLTNTLVRTIGNSVSLISLLIIAFWFIRGKFYEKNS